MSNGLYIAVKFTDSTNNKIHDTFKEVPNLVPKEDLHSTIIFSTKYDDVDLPKPFVSVDSIKGYAVWDNSDKTKKCLIAKLDTKDSKLVDLHNEFMDKYNLDYRYPDYLPHVTISYDVPANILELHKFPDGISLISNKIYSEDLKP